jgi:hypothetical protein
MALETFITNKSMIVWLQYSHVNCKLQSTMAKCLEKCKTFIVV